MNKVFTKHTLARYQYFAHNMVVVMVVVMKHSFSQLFSSMTTTMFPHFNISCIIRQTKMQPHNDIAKHYHPIVDRNYFDVKVQRYLHCSVGHQSEHLEFDVSAALCISTPAHQADPPVVKQHSVMLVAAWKEPCVLHHSPTVARLRHELLLVGSVKG